MPVLDLLRDLRQCRSTVSRRKLYPLILWRIVRRGEIYATNRSIRCVSRVI